MFDLTRYSCYCLTQFLSITLGLSLLFQIKYKKLPCWMKDHTVQNLFCTVIAATHQSPPMQSHAIAQSKLMQFKYEVIFEM